METLETRIIHFVARTTGVATEKISAATSLFHDLGVDGMDGFELMQSFSDEFRVDISAFEFDRHFGPEAGANPFTLMHGMSAPVSRQTDQFIAVRIADLVASARAGQWSVPY